MSGIHADRGDKSHRIVSGETPEVGLRVYTNNLDLGTIVKTEGRGECGWYCDAWHTVALDRDYKGNPIPEVNGHAPTTIMNCERLTTRRPR